MKAVLILSGTAAVCVAGILASLSASKKKLSEHKFLFQGAGEVGCNTNALPVEACIYNVWPLYTMLIYLLQQYIYLFVFVTKLIFLFQ